jgi:hypothetical protein
MKKGLKDSASARRGLVNTFKPVFMPRAGRIDFSRWLALPGRGYCFSAGAPEPAAGAMAMDFITDNGMIAGVVVGPVADCGRAREDLALEQRFRREKPNRGRGGGGC